MVCQGSPGRSVSGRVKWSLVQTFMNAAGPMTAAQAYFHLGSAVALCFVPDDPSRKPCLSGGDMRFTLVFKVGMAGIGVSGKTEA